ncbi:ATP-binding protein [Saccharothrix lopnurensis]|uniref:ATP-binding protein n=1 Tax=Saccharothrix lopnurensis TaxID=1670621 RepID=A0ABW1NZW3_9PSEU
MGSMVCVPVVDRWDRDEVGMADEVAGGSGGLPAGTGQHVVASGSAVTVQAGRDAVVEVRQVVHGPVRRVVPRQLPAAPRVFTGRVAELAALDRVLATAPPDGPGTAAPDGVTVDRAGEALGISVVDGAGGIGKTCLALTWAHRNLDRFPDGQLFVDLRGFSPTGRPADPGEAVRGFLNALGAGPEGLPPDLDAQAALYRSLMTGKRVLVMLDNAATADQVVPLLPGTASCAVLVTSRAVPSSLIDRYGAHRLRLGVLSHEEARAVVTARLGAGRVAAEPGAADELIGLCGHQPLALTIATRRAATHPTTPLAEFTTELRGAGLEALDHDTDPAASLPAVLSWSLRRLTDRQRLAFALLGTIPGPHAGLPATAALLDLPVGETYAVLRALTDASLVDRAPGGRHHMHDLVREYAAVTAGREVDAGARGAALRRVSDFYLRTAHAADRLLNPHRQPLRPDPSAGAANHLDLPDAAAALAWFDVEHVNLLETQRAAAGSASYRTAADLAWSLASYHDRRGHLRERIAAWRVVLDVAGHLPAATLVRAHRHLGRAHADLGLHDAGIEHLGRGLAVAESHGDAVQQAHSHRELGWALVGQGDDRRGLEHALRALELFRALGQPVWEANALNQVAWCEARLGEHEEARARGRAALALHRRHDNPAGAAATLDTLGYVEHRDGHHDRAVDHYEQSLALRRELGNTYRCADTLDRLGHPLVALGDHERARAVWREALRLYQEQGRDDAARTQRQLDDLDGPG